MLLTQYYRLLVVEFTYFYCSQNQHSTVTINLTGEEQWISLTDFSPILKVWSQKLPETVSYLPTIQLSA